MVQAWQTKFAELALSLKGHTEKEALMSKHTSWRIGGPADYLVCPATVDDLIKVYRFAAEFAVPLNLIGRGSNLLVSDAGVEGIVVKIGRDFSQIVKSGDYQLRVEAGCSLTKAANAAIGFSWSGLEWAAGIPGNVGGAVMMNAGAYGSDIASVANEIEVLDLRQSEPRFVTYTPDGLNMGYRRCGLAPGQVVLAVNFCLQPGNIEEMRTKIQAQQQARAAKQPLEYPSAGSVFKNPTGDFAARLIEAVGLKGKTCGQAQISPKHSNFIVNLGDAKAVEVLELIDLAKTKVQAEFGIDLQTEIRPIGRF